MGCPESVGGGFKDMGFEEIKEYINSKSHVDIFKELNEKLIEGLMVII